MVRKKMNLKQEYNKNLQRYYDGCNYLFNHPTEWDKYLPVVKELLNKMNEILKEMPQATEEEILNGFKF